MRLKLNQIKALKWGWHARPMIAVPQLRNPQMPEKKWDDLTQAEKIEELRRDMMRTMDFVNDLHRRLSASGNAIGTVETLAKQVKALAEKTADEIDTLKELVDIEAD